MEPSSLRTSIAREDAGSAVQGGTGGGGRSAVLAGNARENRVQGGEVVAADGASDVALG